MFVFDEMVQIINHVFSRAESEALSLSRKSRRHLALSMCSLNWIKNQGSCLPKTNSYEVNMGYYPVLTSYEYDFCNLELKPSFYFYFITLLCYHSNCCQCIFWELYKTSFLKGYYPFLVFSNENHSKHEKKLLWKKCIALLLC